MIALITGGDSFIGRNLGSELRNRCIERIFEVNGPYDHASLADAVSQSDVIFHLFTIYRSDEPDLFDINISFTRMILDLASEGRKTFVLLSSTQADGESPYGKSKRMAERLVRAWADRTGNRAHIFRLANEFGKWCPPNLNSVVSTFCHNAANGKDLQVFSRSATLRLMYVDDIVNALLVAAEGETEGFYCDVHPVYETTVGEAADIIQSFRDCREDGAIPDLSRELVRKLYSTYTAFLPVKRLSSRPVEHIDKRGAFAELLHFGSQGQVSVNVCVAGVVKGNHWHHTKAEKFIVVSGSGVIRLREVGSKEVVEYKVTGECPEIIDIPPGYVHSLYNTGSKDLVTVMWASEVFDRTKPDTYYEEV